MSSFGESYTRSFDAKLKLRGHEMEEEMEKRVRELRSVWDEEGRERLTEKDSSCAEVLAKKMVLLECIYSHFLERVLKFSFLSLLQLEHYSLLKLNDFTGLNLKLPSGSML